MFLVLFYAFRIFPEIQGPKRWEFGCAFAAADLGGCFVKGGGPAYGSALCGLCGHRSPRQRHGWDVSEAKKLAELAKLAAWSP